MIFTIKHNKVIVTKEEVSKSKDSLKSVTETRTLRVVYNCFLKEVVAFEDLMWDLRRAGKIKVNLAGKEYEWKGKTSIWFESTLQKPFVFLMYTLIMEGNPDLLNKYF